MRITMIVPYFKPEITAAVHLLDDLARDLANKGAEVTVITGYPFRGTSRALRERFMHLADEQLTERIRILRVGQRREEGKVFLMRGIRYLFKTAAFYRVARRIPTDAFFLYSTPPLMGVFGGLLEKKAPTLYCLQDIFPDNLADQGKITSESILFRILRRMEAYIYRTNTRVVTISEDMRQNLIEKQVSADKVFVIENWIDTDEVRLITREDNPLFDQFGLDRAGFYVTYCGNLGYAQDLDTVIKSAKLLEEKAPEVQFLIVGNGVCEDAIKKKITEEKQGNVRMFPLQPEEASAFVYSLGDLGIVALRPQFLKNAMPSKTWAMMAAAQPVLCTAEEHTQLHKLIASTGAGVVVRPGSAEDMAAAIMHLCANRHCLREHGANGRAYAEKYLTREGATSKYYQMLQELAERREKHVSG